MIISLFIQTLSSGQRLPFSSFPYNPVRVTSVLICGEHDCILVDCQWTRANAHRVIAEILETGLELKAIFATHAHPDHYWGMGEISEAFPNASRSWTSGPT